jgi:hypothetical protein
MSRDIREIMNKIMEAGQYDHERGEYYPDFGDEGTYDHYVQQVVEDFDFDNFVEFYDRLFWGQEGLTDEDRELYSDEVIGEITAFLEKELKEIDPVYSGEDMSQYADHIFKSEVKHKLEQAGYVFKDLTEAAPAESQPARSPANSNARIQLQFLPSENAKKWRNAHSMFKNALSNMLHDAPTLKKQEGWYTWRIIDPDTGTVIKTEMTHVPAPAEGGVTVKKLSVYMFPRAIAAKISIYYGFDMLGEWEGKMDRIVNGMVKELEQSILKHGNYNGIVYADEKTGEISIVTNEDHRIGDHYSDGDVNGVVIATVEKG